MRVQARGAGALVLLFMALAPADASPADPLRIVMIDLVGLPEEVERPAVRELRSALSQAGVDVEIRAARPSDEVAEEEMVLVIVPRPAANRSGRRSILGAVLRSTPPRRTAWIHLPTVLETLGLPAALDAASPREQRSTGRAVGRVAAHEVVHLILPERPHAPSGLMAASLGRAALTAPTTRVDLRTREAVCASLGGAAPR
jgi:hypothetical protein